MNYQSLKVAFFCVLVLVTTQFSFAGAIDNKTFKDWQGRCQQVKDQEFCFLLQGFSANKKDPLMITTIDKTQHPKYPIVTFRVSNLLDATKDIQFKIDKNNPIGLKAICTEQECSVAFPLDKRMLGEFKRGKRGVLGFIAKDTGKAVYYPLSLSGVTKALNSLKRK